MMAVRAKFVCEEIVPAADGGEGSGSVKLSAVVSGSPENQSFFKWTPSGELWTPSGELTMGILKPETLSQFELGQEYYLDFTPAEPKQDPQPEKEPADYPTDSVEPG